MSSKKKTTVYHAKKQNNLTLLSKYIQLTCIGLRDAYLVDCCVIDVQTITDHCANILGTMRPELRSTSSGLLVIHVGDDIFVVNQSRFQEKITLLESGPDMFPSQVFVDLDGAQPEAKNRGQVQSICRDLLNSLQQMKYTELASSGGSDISLHLAEFVADEVFLQNVGYPLLAGWLLGYSCVYRSTAPTTLLSALPLKQVSLTASPSAASLIQSCFTYSLSTSSGVSQESIDLQVFTVPAFLCTSDLLSLVENQKIKDDALCKAICTVLGSDSTESYITISYADVCYDSITL